MFMKAANSVAIGEGRTGPERASCPAGETNPMDGDFDTEQRYV